VSEYQPDVWVMLRITSNNVQENPVYKILAGWYGGYAKGDTWKLNSGCTSAETDGDYYVFTGSSRSRYRCHKNSYRTNYLTGSVLTGLQKNNTTFTIQLLPETTNFLELDYE
jgi:hypothetical protein